MSTCLNMQLRLQDTHRNRFDTFDMFEPIAKNKLLFHPQYHIDLASLYEIMFPNDGQ
jgi:hypothetical protein